ncbi:MAG: ROK family protein [Planctomycetota bacterium]
MTMALDEVEDVYCGVDLGGTSAKLVFGNRAGEIREQVQFPTQNEGAPTRVLPRIVEHVKQFLDCHSLSKVHGVGIGVPGLVDIDAGVTKFLPNMPTQWRDVPVAETLTSELGCPVRVLNDARAATLGELRFGFGKDRPNDTFAFFGIGTGVGGGIVIDGKLRLGPLGAAGEIGHQTILPDGPRCGCGNRGCLETLVSGPAIAAEGMRLVRMGLAPRLAELTDNDLNRVTPESMKTAAASDSLVAEALQRAGAFLGIAVANVITSLHPDAVIIGGGVARLGETLLSPVRKTVLERVRMFPPDDVQIVSSTLLDRSGRLGTLALASEE